MMDWFVGVEVPIAFTEFLIAVMFFKHFLGKKYESKLLFLATAVLYIVVAALHPNCTSNIAIAFSASTAFFFSLTLLFNGNIKVKIFATALLIGFMMLSDLIAVFGLTWIAGIDVADVFDRSIIQLIAVISSRVILLVITRVICIFRTGDNTYIPPLHWLSLLIFPLVSILVIYSITTGIYTNYGGNTELFPLIFIGLLFANILVFQLFESFSEKMAIEFRNQVLETEYKRMMSEQKAKQRFFHDFEKHVEALYNIAQKDNIEEILRYLSSLNKINVIRKAHIYTGNVSIDAIFNAKIQEAKEKHIKIEKEVYIPQNIDLDPMDLCTLLANAWDNAIEACMRILEGERYIDVSLQYKDEQLRFRITNPTDGKIVCNANYFQTSKDNARSHGLGLGNIERTVEKYGGVFRIIYDNKANTFTIIFSIHAPVRERKYIRMASIR